jgi:streptomycin 6-kinase
MTATLLWVRGCPPGEPIITRTSRLLPVRSGSVPAMLKVALIDEERIGGLLMQWWDGHGAARVMAHDKNAILMERAVTGASLPDLARNRDDDASRIICTVLAQLHTPRGHPPVSLVALTEWFEPLRAAAEARGGLFRFAASTASDLLSTQQEIVVHHGDIHHRNVLNFGSRGWLAIDPKGLIGERYFDYANIFCNPDHEMAIQCRDAYRARYKWSQRRRIWNVIGCWHGSLHGLACLPPFSLMRGCYQAGNSRWQSWQLRS